ncbi:hypothetical protein H5T88_09185 [bacterium]|nr:hypothetical protein [bacterium]
MKRKKKRGTPAKPPRISPQKIAEQKIEKPSILQQVRLGLRLLALALFPFADVYQILDLEWLALVFLLGSALVFYEMLDHYRKERYWRGFWLVLLFYILSFGSLMLAISLHFSWVDSSSLSLKILFTIPRLVGAYYLVKILPQIYPYR